MKALWIISILLFASSSLADRAVTTYNSDIQRLKEIGKKANSIGNALRAELSKKEPKKNIIQRSAASLLVEMGKYDRLREGLQKRRNSVKQRAQPKNLKVQGIPQSLRLDPAARSLADSLKNKQRIGDRAIRRAQDKLPRSARPTIPRMPPGSGGSYP